jgi:arginyl-tRNA synthetase
MTSSKVSGLKPSLFAGLIVTELQNNSVEISKVDVAGPGFINITLKPEYIASFLPSINAESLRREARTANALKINVEFVSVNPNGPITIGSGRGAAYGSSLCNVLEYVGNEVHREYYINDGVNSEQMRLFAESVRAAIIGSEPPENGYKGTYISDLAEKLVSQDGIKNIETELNSLITKNPTSASAKTVNALILRALVIISNLNRNDLIESYKTISTSDAQLLMGWCMVAQQKTALSDFGVTFDTWFSEMSLHESGVVEESTKELCEKSVADDEAYRTKITFSKGGVIEDTIKEDQPKDENDSEGNLNTLWLRSTKFGDDMDRVLRRKDGRLTYIASDVAYHADKFNRPFNADKLITILGPDHHGYIGRLTAVVAAMLMPKSGHDYEKAHTEAKERLEVLIFQLVRFTKDGKPAPMRKRDGNIYALSDLISEIGMKIKPEESKETQTLFGRDVSRFFYLMRSHDTTFDFDLDLAARQSEENPVFYVQYAHARICSIIDKAKAVNIVANSNNSNLLIHSKESMLIKKIMDYPIEVRRTSTDYSVHRIATYVSELARAFHSFYDSCVVINESSPELSGARVSLCNSTRLAILESLKLLGISAPDRM